MSSFILFLPDFPPALEHEHVRNLRVLAQPFRKLPREIATLRAAIHNYLLPRRPRSQKLRQQSVPAIFVQRNRTRRMIASTLGIRPGVNPYGTVTPLARLIDAHHFRR